MVECIALAVDVGDRMFLAGATDVNYTLDYNDDRQITTAASKTWSGINRPRFAVCRLINDVSVEGYDSVRWRVPRSVVCEAPRRPPRVRMAPSGAGAIHQHTGCLLIFSLRPANPIQFATFERRSATTSNAPCCDREKSAPARSFFLIYCVSGAYLSVRSRAAVARAPVFSRVARPSPWRRRAEQRNRKSSHLPPLWLSRQPSFRCVVRHCQDFEVTSSASWHWQVSAAISLRVGPLGRRLLAGRSEMI